MTAPVDQLLGLLAGVVCLGVAVASVVVAPAASDPFPASAGALFIEPDRQAALLRPEVLTEVPHEPEAFTQGVDVADDALYESTGLWGKSQLRELDPATGVLRRSVPLPDSMFGEGIAAAGDRIWQLNWTQNVALEWSRETFTLLRTVPFTGAGRGLCFDGGRLIRSDGTGRLRFHDPITFSELGSVPVTQDGRPVDHLNDLECHNGQVWAGVRETGRIVAIDPTAGRVTAVVDTAEMLRGDARVGADVLNGIAALDDGTFLLTGRLWPVTFRVRFVDAAREPATRAVGTGRVSEQNAVPAWSARVPAEGRRGPGAG